MQRRRAFTLIEVLVSIALISLVLLGLYKSLAIQRSSNRHLHDYLQRALAKDKVVMTLYKDILSSDGNLSLHKGEFDRLCLNNTAHSLYGLASPKVCWLVLKEGKTLVRVEGGDYRLPLRSDDRVALDRVMEGMELFDIYRSGGDLLVAMQTKGEKPYAFLVQAIAPPPKPKPKLKSKITAGQAKKKVPLKKHAVGK